MDSRQFCSVCRQWLDMEVVPTADGDDDGVVWFRCPQCQGFLPKLRSAPAAAAAGPVAADGDGGADRRDRLDGGGPVDDQKQDDQRQDDRTQDDRTQDDRTQDDRTQDDRTQDDRTPDDLTQDDLTPGDQTPDDQTQDDQTPGDPTPDDQTPGDPTPDDLAWDDEPPQDEAQGDEPRDGSALDHDPARRARTDTPAEPVLEYAARLAAVDPATAVPYRPWETYEIGQCVLHLAWNDCGIVVAKEALPGGRRVVKCWFQGAGVVRLIENAPQ